VLSVGLLMVTPSAMEIKVGQRQTEALEELRHGGWDRQ